ncbi:MAG TPA: hypothetical protein VMD59_11660 [Acidimicrobiales bacterium]|nr:hypothetical protein [Acidimicrobiales bacterium]
MTDTVRTRPKGIVVRRRHIRVIAAAGGSYAAQSDGSSLASTGAATKSASADSIMPLFQAVQHCICAAGIYPTGR